jgi:hypothetical protein
MPLKDDLLQKGYLPENLPPAFQSEELGKELAVHSTWLGDGKTTVRAAPFNASKRGMTRREFSFVHPTTAHDLAHFMGERETQLTAFFERSPFSLSCPRSTPSGDRAVEIASHSEIEGQRLSRLARYRFIARTDISRFYHSIYTHSVPWAIHGKAASKADRSPTSASLYANRLDLILRAGQDGQTVGIPVGPDTSRFVAEAIGTAIDLEFIRRGGNERCKVIRHVDDVWIGADTHEDAEEALWRYRASIRAFELDINESKTAIYAEHFRFSDVWPTEIASKFELAGSSSHRRIPERLRAALEHAFSLATANRDDGVLKYTLRYLDRSNLAVSHWEVIEPFLKRAAVHFGHSIDYVVRIIVWRHLAFQDLSIAEWTPLLLSVLAQHGRLGNDGEVTWVLYAAIRLNVRVPASIATSIAQNCGPLSVIALLSCVDLGLVDQQAFDVVRAVIETETASGPYWPLLLEWHSRQWTGYSRLKLANEVVSALSARGITIFERGRLPSVFEDVDEDDFGGVTSAIEARPSQYDDDGEEDEDEDEEDPDF